jgi:hypothetical protein
MQLAYIEAANLRGCPLLSVVVSHTCDRKKEKVARMGKPAWEQGLRNL